MFSLCVLTCYRANEVGTPPPRSVTPFDYVESSISEGEAFRTHEMGFIGPIRLIRLIIRHYESDEDLGFGFDGGCDAAGGMPTGESRTGEGCTR